ncbi:MAG TPA: hypothetical protein VK957_03220 [Lunatimonas sp.]|nr:hypothetical protein [Lunatimonas sp.]
MGEYPRWGNGCRVWGRASGTDGAEGTMRVAAIDPLDYRLDMANKTNNVETINPKNKNVVEKIREMTRELMPVMMPSVWKRSETS